MDDVASDRWRVLSDMQSGRGDPGVVTLNGKIHVVSGYFSPGFGYSSSQEVYDPQTDSWQYLWGFPVPRSDMVALNVGYKIYAIGGWNMDLGGVQGYNHMYDPTLNTWITMTSMITPVSGAGGVVLSDTIYIIGGYDGTNAIRDIQIYNPAKDEWSIGTSLSTARNEFSAVVLDGLIYAIGGTGDIHDFEIYDPAADKWNYAPPLPETRYSMAVVERKGKIYVIGGTDISGSDNIKDTMFIYDPTLGVWSIGDAMPTARRACRGTVISDTIHVIGGMGEDGAGTANEAYADFDMVASTTEIFADDPDPSQAFQPFLVSYLVTSSSIIPTGVVTVTVNQNDIQCSEPLIDGVGSCEIALDIPGSYTLNATYGGDDWHSGSSDSENHIVVKAETSTAILGNEPNPSLQGQPISVEFGVSSTYGSPSGVVTVTVSDSQQSCSDELAGGLGSCEISLDTTGSYSITAIYPGNLSFAASSASTEHLVVDMLRLYLPMIKRE